MSQVKAGFSRQEITAWEPDMQIWGWFLPENRASGVSMPLFSRALVLKAGEQTAAYVCMDLGYISVAMRKCVLRILESEHRALGIGPHNLMLTATHTHAGPSGFSDVIGQNSVNYGFSPRVLVKVVEGAVRSIVDAANALEPASLRVGHAEIPLDEPVAFNRSVRSFNRNVDQPTVPSDAPAQATRRRTVSLRVDDAKGRMMGLVNWFGVHATCVHAENTLLHPDNKGVAAHLAEQRLRESTSGRPDFVALFAQDAAGDVSPNYRYHAKRKKVIGGDDDDLKSVESNGEIQFRYAMAAAQQALSSAAWKPDVREPGIGGLVRHVDLPDTEIDPFYAQGQRGCRTVHATWGLSMPAGTPEGPGPFRPLMPMLRLWGQARQLKARARSLRRDAKISFLELGRGVSGRFLGFIPAKRGLGLVGLMDPTIGYVHAVDGKGLLEFQEPWLPERLPVQILRLGPVAVLGLSGEPTTTSGARLRKILREGWPTWQVPELIVNGYANGFAGYITTPEEYTAQEYEGGYTLFGRWTLGAYQMIAKGLVERGLAEHGWAQLEGPPLLSNSFEVLMARRKLGRKGAWGRGTEPGIPMPHSLFLKKVQRALAVGPHYFSGTLPEGIDEA